MKELPIPRGENWFGHEGKASKRLLYEIKWMKDFFKLQEWHRIDPPITDWDTEWFYIKPCVLRLHPIKETNYPLGWDIQFSMFDGDYLCNQNQVWTIKLFYPSGYPFKEPATSVLDSRGYVIHGDKNRGTFSVEGINYLYGCLYSNHTHNPGKDHAAIYAGRSIEWLRSCLYSKQHRVEMPFYV